MVSRLETFSRKLGEAPFWLREEPDLARYGQLAYDFLRCLPDFGPAVSEIAQTDIVGVAKEPRKAVRVKSKADQLVQEQRFDEALKRYTTALRLSFEDKSAEDSAFVAKVYCNRALCLLRGGSDCQAAAQQVCQGHCWQSLRDSHAAAAKLSDRVLS